MEGLLFPSEKLPNLEYKTFEIFTPFPEIKAKSYFRQGGFSESPYDSLNGSFSVGDEKKSVFLNRKKVQEDLGMRHLYFANLDHGTAFFEVTAKNCEEKPFADSLLTKDKEIGLAMTHADCQIALFYDPIEGIICAVHAGWRGLVKNIYAKTVERCKKLGSKPENIFVAISASLGKDHAEYLSYKELFPKSHWKYFDENSRGDLQALAEEQMRSSGILSDHLETDKTCTACNEERYFSYRKSRVTGRCISAIGRH